MTRVLIVDDSKLLTRTLKALLESLDFAVVATGQDGHEGLVLYREHRPDITLLDITMPNMDGVDCLGEIRKLDANARVIMLSAVQNKDVVDKCRQAGAFDFLSKPIKVNDPADLERLARTLRRALQGNESSPSSSGHAVGVEVEASLALMAVS